VREVGYKKELKFLGLTYNGVTDKLRSSTREGAELTFDREGLVAAVDSQGLMVPSDFMAGSASDFEAYMVYYWSGPRYMFRTLSEARRKKLELERDKIYAKIARIGPDALILSDDIDAEVS
jgi:hypothetical protein